MSDANNSERDLVEKTHREAFAKLLADYGSAPRNNDYDLERNSYRFADLMRLYEAARQQFESQKDSNESCNSQLQPAAPPQTPAPQGEMPELKTLRELVEAWEDWNRWENPERPCRAPQEKIERTAAVIRFFNALSAARGLLDTALDSIPQGARHEGGEGEGK